MEDKQALRIKELELERDYYQNQLEVARDDIVWLTNRLESTRALLKKGLDHHVQHIQAS